MPDDAVNRHFLPFPPSTMPSRVICCLWLGLLGCLLLLAVPRVGAGPLFALPRPAKVDSILRADSLAKLELLRKSKAKPDTVDLLGSATDTSESGDASEAKDAQPPDSSRLAKPSNENLDDTLAVADDTVDYQAARIRYRNDRFSLADGALLTFKGSRLEADSIVYFHEENLVEAFGAPLISDKDNPPILGYRMRYNIKKRVGEVYWGSSKKGNQVFNGIEVRRQKSGAIYIARGDFSTCDQKPDQHFYFYGRRMIVEPNSKVLSGPIVMNIGDVPVAVLPMLVMPLGSGRRSGLLQPKFGGDQAQGFYITGLGYYWAIDEYMDAELSGDVIEGAQGTFSNTNVNWQYRYNKRSVLNSSVGGKWYISEFDPSTAGWLVDFNTDWNVTPDGKQTVKGSGRFQSDPNIVANNALTEEERVKQTANANLGYRRQFNWNQASLNVDLKQDNNLTDNLVDRSIPDLSFRVGGPLFPVPELDEDDLPDSGSLPDEPFYRKISWNYDNRFNVNQVSRPAKVAPPGDTSTYVGYADHLAFTGKYNLLQYLNLTPSLNMSQLWSLTSKTGDPQNPTQVAYDPENGEVGDYFFAWNTAANFDTRLYGIAQAEPGKAWFGVLQGIRHTLAPRTGFTYAPEIDSNTHFAANPKVGGLPYQAEQRTLGLGLDNDIDLKFASTDSSKKTEPYKMLTANTSTSYNFALDEREWGDINSNLSLYVTRNIAFTVSFVHGLYDDYAPDINAINTPVLKSYRFGWRKGLSLQGDFSSGLKMKDAPGFADERYGTSPWSMDLNYSFDFNASRVAGMDGDPASRFFGFSEVYQVTKTHQASGSLKFNPTFNWQLSYDTDYNFADGEFSRHNFNIHRKLHCWDMDFRWTPVGLSEGWSFVIRIIDLPDIKLQTADQGGKGAKRRL